MDRPSASRDARRALAAGRADEALRLAWWLAEQTHVPEAEYADSLRVLAAAFGALGRSRAASFVQLYLGDADSMRATAAQAHPEDLARLEELLERFEAAGDLYLAAGRMAAAAICFERAGVHVRARGLWERLALDRRLAESTYSAALVAFNHGRCCRALGDRTAARRSMVEAVRLLEEAADELESAGTRERAFDCFQVLLAMGAGEEGAFENLAEGYVNCIRILKADSLRYYVLQYYEDFQRKALEADELHAAATILREASDYCLRLGLPYDRYYQRRSAETWALTADRVLERGHPAELSENALLAAVDLYGSLGDFVRVGECYERLAALPLDDKRTERYARIAARYVGATSVRESQAAFPEYLRQDAAYPDVWYLDVVEWEQSGDFREVAADLIASKEYPESIRRRALLCRLEVLGAEETTGLTEEALVRVALRLGHLTTYTALSPLERLYEEGGEPVRAAAMGALRSLFFKRSFRLLGLGLADRSSAVRREALEAVRALHFTHALDPLARLYREHSDPAVRLVALQSIGKISTPDAAELLLEVVRHGGGQEAILARDLLTQLSHPEVGPLLARHAAAERSEARQRIVEILRRRGDPVPAA